MNDRLNIPKNLKVGFQKRSDTYSGLLSYITYINNKGDIAKERSWRGWKDDSIPVQDIENNPISGFVLNRHAGGYKSGWNFRQSYCRVWDPRGFEFEIKIDNLLFILDNCTSTKGRGLEGEFVYAWDGQDLLLLPVDTEDYRKSVETINRTVTITAKDLNIGTVYETKDGREVVYLGKHPVISSDTKYDWGHYDYSSYTTNFKCKKEHIFVDNSDLPAEERKFYRASDAKKLISVVADKAVSLSDCKDLEEFVLKKIWRDSTEYQLGELNIICKDDLKVWDESVDDSNMHYGLYSVNPDKVFIFEFRVNHTSTWNGRESKPVLSVDHMYMYEKLSDTSFKYYPRYDKRSVYDIIENSFGIKFNDFNGLMTVDVRLVPKEYIVKEYDGKNYAVTAGNQYGYKALIGAYERDILHLL